MTGIPFSKRQFGAGVDGDFQVSLTANALIRAAVVAGRRPVPGPKTVAAKADIQMRINAVQSAVELIGGRLVPTSEYLAAGSTDKSHKSYYVGNALCAHAANAELHIPWLADFERLPVNYRVTKKKNVSQRPDFLGRSVKRKWFVFETKGKAKSPSEAELKEWKKQAEAVTHVNAARVQLSIVSAAFLTKPPEWNLLWVDPPPEDEGIEVQLDEFAFFQEYYAPIFDFLRTSNERIAASNGVVAPVGDSGVYVGLHRDILSAITERNPELIWRVAEELGVPSRETPDSTTFRDGIIVQTREGFRSKAEGWLPSFGGEAPPGESPVGRLEHVSVGQREILAQRRVVELFTDRTHRFCLRYGYLGNWKEREAIEGQDNRNIETRLLAEWLRMQGHNEQIIDKVLFELEKVANDTSKSLYDRNKEFYGLLRYGVSVRPEAGENKTLVRVIDWDHPDRNDFCIAEEVTVRPRAANAHIKRPDLVVYVNGIALAVLELKRSTVSVAEGIRQNYDSQKKEFIEPFFSTVQLIMAGSDTEGLRYGTTRTREKYYLAWKEERPDWRPGVDTANKYMTQPDYPGVDSRLDVALIQLCNKERLLDLIHNFVVFDGGTKKLCRHNQYFGVRAAQAYVKRREGGIIWQTQGSGKSMVMVWLTKWIRENVSDARVLIITDRQELDEQIHERVFKPAGEEIYRTRSGQDLIATLNLKKPWLICSLIHKFGGKSDSDTEADDFIREMKKSLPADFKAKGNLFVLVDECHRTQSGMLHDAMKGILPDAVFIGFTGTPLLKKDKQTTLELFGNYIHTYKFDEAVADGVVLDLRYEAREIDQEITSQRRIDEWFELKTRGLTDLAKAQLKQRWGTMQKVLSSRSRLDMIVNDILVDMEKCDRLRSGRGNAILVAGSIYEACKYFDLFDKTHLHGQCAIVTSYVPSVATIKGEDSGEGQTEKLEQYEIYKKMLGDWFDVSPEQAVNRVEEFEKAVKKKFIEDPGEMKLLIVVDKLLTGFDAPPATFLYIDKKMQDHGLFQAICRVNRLDGEDKEFGYIVDYKDLFRSLEGAVQDYTSGAFDAYDKEDVAGLLEDRLEKAQERLEDALEQIRALCEPVEMPRDQAAYFRYFSSEEPGNAEQRKANEPQRLALYKLTASLIRAYANIADEISDAGYSEAQAEAIKKEVAFYENLRTEVKIHSADAIDLKQYEPSMRHLIDTYIRANPSEIISKFDDFSLVQLIVERGAEAVKALPESIQRRQEAVAETIENNVRKLIIDESPINPKYYERMSELLDALIKQRRDDAIKYSEYLGKIVELTKQVKSGPAQAAYPHAMNTPARKALYDNLGKNHVLALAVDEAVQRSRQDEWRSNTFKTRRVRNAIRTALQEWSVPPKPTQEDGAPATFQENASPCEAPTDAEIDRILELVKNQNEY